MKVRKGFVSNSSSSSFVINLSDITERHIEDIENHIKRNNEIKEERDQQNENIDDEYNYVTTLDIACDDDSWDITVDREEGKISGYTSMDNFSMYSFLRDGLRLDQSLVDWDDY